MGGAASHEEEGSCHPGVCECTESFSCEWVAAGCAHLAGLQHADLLFIHRVLVLLQEAFTLVLNLPNTQSVTAAGSTSSCFSCSLQFDFQSSISDHVYQHLTNNGNNRKHCWGSSHSRSGKTVQERTFVQWGGLREFLTHLSLSSSREPKNRHEIQLCLLQLL